MERVQAFISREDFDTLFRNGIWLRGGQNRIIALLLKHFAVIVREHGIVSPELENTVKVLRLLQNLQLTSHIEPHGN